MADQAIEYSVEDALHPLIKAAGIGVPVYVGVDNDVPDYSCILIYCPSASPLELGDGYPSLQGNFMVEAHVRVITDMKQTTRATHIARVKSCQDIIYSDDLHTSMTAHAGLTALGAVRFNGSQAFVSKSCYVHDTSVLIPCRATDES